MVNYENNLHNTSKNWIIKIPLKNSKKIDDISLLEIHLKRIKKSKQIDKLIVATTEKKEDNVIVKIAENENIEFLGERNMMF